MRKSVLTILTLAGLWMQPLPGACAVEADGTRPPAANQPAANQKKPYEQSMEERLRTLGRQLDELKARTGTMAEQARKAADRYLRDAEQKREDALRKLERMKAGGRKRWDTFSRELNAAVEEFEKAFERAKTHFKSEQPEK